jgi:putative restriction endonuclease
LIVEFGVNVYVYTTDRSWYTFLRDQRVSDEVNFWRPGGKQGFRQLEPGDLFLFRFGRPDNAIVGGGTYTHFSFSPIARAWGAFGEKNGTSSFAGFCELVARYKKTDPRLTEAADDIVGSIVLTAPFFLPERCWLPVPTEPESCNRARVT